MENRLHVTVEIAGQQAVEKILLVQIIGDFTIDQIPEFIRPLQVINSDDVLFAPVIERLDDVRTDESGRAGNDGVHENSLLSKR